MKFARPVLAVTAALAVAGWLSAPHVFARQAAPGAPSNLTYLLNGTFLTMTWTHATGPFTHYVIDVGVAPGSPFVQFSTATFVDPSKLPQMLASVTNPAAPTGTYYVAVHGANGGVVGPASPEIQVPITGACRAPGAPTNLTAIVRGTASWFMWNPGSGGLPSAYVLQASTGSGAAFNAGLLGEGAFGAPAFNVPLPAGTYYLRAYSVNACGTSGFSNEVTVTANVNTPATTPNPVAGARLPQPDVRAMVMQVAQQAVNQGLLDGAVSCPSRPGFPDSDIEARKVNLNPYINYMVDNLRTIDRRFGYNAKPTRAQIPAVVAGDEIAYHYGSDSPEGSPNVYLVDVLGGHCTFGNENPDYRTFYNEFGKWTGAGRF